ncbi:MAG: response regulator [Planctomycetota bacterium]|mgnify:CR=1 FL=1
MDGSTEEGVARADLLLVDNDERIVELLTWFLRDRGFEVRAAGSFAAARDLLTERRPDLVLSDVDLGTESAVAELPRLSEDGLLPATLVVSGYLDAQIEAALLAVPEVVGTLAKPFEFPDLETEVVACLERDLLPQLPADASPVPAPASDLESAPPPAPERDAAPDDDGWIEITPRR